MPRHLLDADFEKIPLSIPQKDVNDFLSELWDVFAETIGRVSCQHSYIKKSNEVFEYNICWASNELPFIAELSFFNHTAKGLIFVLLETLDFESRLHDPEYHQVIKNAIIRCSKRRFGIADKQPSGYMSVPVRSENTLSGSYLFEFSGILLIKTDEADFNMVFPVFNSNSYELTFETQTASVNLAAILSLLTQNLFTVNEFVEWKFMENSDYYELVSNAKFNGKYFPDSGLIFDDEKVSSESVRYIGNDPQARKEIIEKGDCIVNGELRIPERTDILIDIVGKNYRLQQASRRFHEGLMFRNQTKRTSSSIYYAAYELVAYVAAVEACLDTETQKTEVACPSCGATVYKEDRKISEKFRQFVEKNTESNQVLISAFKDLYNDRSMFVHTGINLHTLYSLRPNRPLILRGKRYQSELPNYYYNIHEYTGFLLRRYFYRQLVCEINDLD
ncbi:hypothetical protein KV699_04100 [Vreelandella titanicae]|nr:hypothetical protein [Halomonas sp. KHS3]KIN15695.1 hypothetical protein RO22_03245 [Halomonas sp. KHS3]